MAKYARGHAAWGICGRSAIKMLLKDMVFDGRFPNMRVHPDWFEPKDPLDYAPRLDDPVALWRPAPDNWHIVPPVLTLVSQEVDVELAWTAATSDAYQIESYFVYYRLIEGDPEWTLWNQYLVQRDLFGAITYEPLNDLVSVPGDDYEFMVAAQDSGGLAANSNIVEMEPSTVHIVDHSFWSAGQPGTGNQEPRIRANIEGGNLGTIAQLTCQGIIGFTSQQFVDSQEIPYYTSPDEWFSPGLPTPATYEVRFTKGIETIINAAGTLSAPFDVWIPMVGDSTDTLVALNVILFGLASIYSVPVTVEIRRASTLVVLDTAIWTLTGAQYSPGPPPDSCDQIGLTPGIFGDRIGYVSGGYGSVVLFQNWWDNTSNPNPWALVGIFYDSGDDTITLQVLTNGLTNSGSPVTANAIESLTLDFTAYMYFDAVFTADIGGGVSQWVWSEPSPPFLPVVASCCSLGQPS